LTEASDIDAALETLVAHRTDADSIVSVAELVSTHPAFAVNMNDIGLMRPYGAQSFDRLPRRQDVEQLFSLDGSLYISSTEALRAQKGFCHARTLSHLMPRYKSFEVDDLVDFICIEAILAQRDFIHSSKA
jgi:N-acylneuraminate cytidylyltransferase/CMP-N,N'-diacetyllegionaminic acid synthase